MAMISNRYKPEADFESTDFKKLIETIQQIESEQTSESFDSKLKESISRVQLQKPLGIRINNALEQMQKWIGENKLPSLALVAVAIVLIIFLPSVIKRNGMPTQEQIAKTEKTTPVDTNKSVTVPPEHKDLANASTNDSDIYFKNLTLRVNKNLQYGFIQKVDVGTVRRIVRGKDFRELISRYRKPGAEDTVKTILKLINE